MHSIVNSKSLFGYNLNQMIFEWGTFLGDIGLKYLFELWTPYIFFLNTPEFEFSENPEKYYKITKIV